VAYLTAGQHAGGCVGAMSYFTASSEPPGQWAGKGAAALGLAWLERHAAYTRTGHHSAQTGEWRDGDGLVASLFLHHISRDGDPHLHVHVAVWNRVQRADGADEKWRTRPYPPLFTFPLQESDFLELRICGQCVLDVARTGPGSMEAVGSQGLPLPALGPRRSDLPGTTRVTGT
jgi:TrwC relaxase